MHIEKDVSNVLWHGTTNLTTANTATQVISASIKPLKGVQLKAGISNGGIVYVGNSGINGTTTNGACGFPLDAGEALFLPLEDPTIIYAFNATANDVLHWIIL